MKLFSSLSLALLASSVLLLSACDSPNKVHLGDTVTLNYTASFADKTVFETNEGKSPLVFVVGSGEVIKGLEEGVLGMKAGQSKTLTITPDKGYAALYDQMKVQKISQLLFERIGGKMSSKDIQTLGDIQGVVKGEEKDAQGNMLVLFDVNPRQTWDDLNYAITVIEKK